MIILASGPSLCDEDIDAAKASGHRLITVNETHWRAGRPDHHVADDLSWWRHNLDIVHPSAKRWTVSRQAAKRYGLNKLPYYQHHLSGITAIKLAIHLGAKRIILLGYDCQATDGQSHWHGDHSAQVRPNPKPYDFERWRRLFDRFAATLPAGVEVINCSRETALTCFNLLPLNEALA